MLIRPWKHPSQADGFAKPGQPAFDFRQSSGIPFCSFITPAFYVKIISAIELNENPGPVVVDVRLFEDYQHCRIPGAISRSHSVIVFQHWNPEPT